MKCANCGADVNGNVCEYCGTHYEGKHIKAEFVDTDHVGLLTIGNMEYTVYISDVEIDTLYRDTGRDISGRIMSPVVVRKRKFTLVEL